MLTWAQMEETACTWRRPWSTGRSTPGCSSPQPASSSPPVSSSPTCCRGGSWLPAPGPLTVATTRVCHHTPPQTGSWSTLSPKMNQLVSSWARPPPVIYQTWFSSEFPSQCLLGCPKTNFFLRLSMYFYMVCVLAIQGPMQNFRPLASKTSHGHHFL